MHAPKSSSESAPKINTAGLMKNLLFRPIRHGCSPLLAALFCLGLHAETRPPNGFTALFNGTDLSGWRGGDTFDHRKLLAMSPDERAKQIAEWTKSMAAHWRAEKGGLVNDGQGAEATTEKDHGQFQLVVGYCTVPPADSRLYFPPPPPPPICAPTHKQQCFLRP